MHGVCISLIAGCRCARDLDIHMDECRRKECLMTLVTIPITPHQLSFFKMCFRLSALPNIPTPCRHLFPRNASIGPPTDYSHHLSAFATPNL